MLTLVEVIRNNKKLNIREDIATIRKVQKGIHVSFLVVKD